MSGGKIDLTKLKIDPSRLVKGNILTDEEMEHYRPGCVHIVKIKGVTFTFGCLHSGEITFVSRDVNELLNPTTAEPDAPTAAAPPPPPTTAAPKPLDKESPPASPQRPASIEKIAPSASERKGESGEDGDGEEELEEEVLEEGAGGAITGPPRAGLLATAWGDGEDSEETPPPHVELTVAGAGTIGGGAGIIGGGAFGGGIGGTGAFMAAAADDSSHL
ncbi:MAG: hypothetical protein RLN62_03055 [Rickettsiales bacterium]